MIARANWKWYGFPGHYICSDDCHFHIVTRVGRWIVSSIGAKRRGDGPLETIGEDGTVPGSGRTYETKVFPIAHAETKQCGCGQPHAMTWRELDSRGYTDSNAALAGHLAMCEKWAAIDRIPRKTT